MIRQVQVAVRKAFHPAVVAQALSTNFINKVSVTSIVEGHPIGPATNLVQDPRYVLPKGQEKEGFMFFLSPLMRKGFQSFGSLFLSVVNPSLTQSIPNSNSVKAYKPHFKKLMEKWTLTQPQVFVSVRMNTESATVRVPLFICDNPAYNPTLAATARFYTNNPDVPTLQEVLGMETTIEGIKRKATDIPAQAKASFSSRAWLALKKANATLEIVRTPGENFLLMAEFELSKDICQHMLNTSWVQIRPIDLHGPIYSWVAGRFGVMNKPAKFTMPISKIAATLPKGGKPRLNEDGILVTHNGEALALPTEVDNISKYDSELSGALVKPDGSYSIKALDGSANKLPPAQPVFIDWVNMKFAYTSVDGLLQIMSLDRCMPLNISHVRTILNSKLIDDEMSYFFSLVGQLNIAMFQGEVVDLRLFLAEVSTAINEGGNDLVTNVDVTLLHVFEAKEKSVRARTFISACEKILALAKTSIANLYERYSVGTIAKVVAYATIFCKYAPKYAEVVTKDNERRKAALNQKVDPNWKPGSLPYLAQDRGFMPHQAKVSNLLKDSPDFAIIPVDAGGGKTMLCITDILKELKSGSVKLALIMCPSHLVKDYVRELVYATDGRVNAIPVTSYTIRKHTMEGLFKMIQSAPINTVVITDYNLANSPAKKVAVGYGTTTTRVFPVVDMLRRFNFDYVLCDESHLLKNVSTRQEAVNRLIADIPKRRLASGTMIADTIRDLPKQIGLLDPTIFGSPDKFIKEYALEVRGDKVISWKPGAELAIMRKIKEHVVIAGAKRKEWAAILPTPVENFHQADMTPRQQEVYGMILNEVVDEIKKEIQAGNKKLISLFSGRAEDDDATDEEEDDEPVDVNIDKLLKAHLARLEKYVTTPGSDPLGATMLTGEDLVSPKVLKIVEICKSHLESNTPGKILIFTNYKESARVIYEMFPPELKSKAIHYTASMKDECGAQFEKDDSKRIMVGVEYSMNTGLNLQYCFPKQTHVLIDHDKSLSIEDIYNNDSVTHVLSYDLKNKRIEEKRILRKIRTKVKDTDKFVTVRVRDNKSGLESTIVCTSNHNFFTKGGHEVEAGLLNKGDQLITYGQSFERCKIEEETGEVVEKSRQVKSACPECGQFLYGGAHAKHMADVHCLNLEKREQNRLIKSNAQKANWKKTSYREVITSSVREFYSTEEGKQVISKASKARWAKEGAKERHSQVMREQWADAEYKELVSNAISAALTQPETRALLSYNSTRLWEDSSYRAKRSKSIDAYWADPKNREERSKLSKDVWSRPEVHAKYMESLAVANSFLSRKDSRQDEMLKRHQDPEYTARTIGAMLRAQGELPNKPERNVIELGIEGLHYTGDGTYFVSLNFRGSKITKNPDFISMNHVSKKDRTRKVVEIIGCREYTGRDAAHDRDLIEAYAEKGIECLIINAEDCYEQEDLAQVHARLQSFINNHYLTVVHVQKAHNSSNTVGKFKYDLEVEDNHNYFACTMLGKQSIDGKRVSLPILVHNCSRLIRVETLWTPGNREQGDARIGRPNIKMKETRGEIYYDWVIANKSIDVTKVGYLVAKTISKAKADYAGDPNYDRLETPELFSMTLDLIRETNDINTALAPYFGAYNEYKQTIFRDYKAYREAHADQVDENGRMKMVPLESAPYLPGSKMMSRVPYVPGTELYKAADLGLVRYDDFMRQHADYDEADVEDADDDEDDDAPEVEDATQREKNRRDMANLHGLYVHTEFGDGEIMSLVGKQAMWVRFSDGTKVKVNRMATFVITRAQTNCKDMRILLMKEHGDIPLNEPITVRDMGVVIPVKNKKGEQAPEEETINVELSITIVNDFLGLQMTNVADNPDAARALEALGFRHPQAYVYAQMKTPQHMFNLFKKWNEAGFTLPQENNTSCKETYLRLLKMRKNAVSLIGVATQAALRNFYRMEFKPNPDPNVIMPYPLVIDDLLYVALPVTGHPGTKKALAKVKVPGVSWYQIDPQDELAGFASTPAKLDEIIKKILARGINITNIKDLAKQRKRLRRATQLLENN